jgi:hypothetical protein
VATAAVTALLSAALAAIDGTAVDVQVSGRAEASGSGFSRDGSAPHGLAATDVLPRVSLLLDRKIQRLTLGYEPQLRLSRDLTFSESYAALAHGGFARAGWDLSPIWRATGAARASVRLVDLVAPAGDLGRLLELRSGASTVRFFDSAASAGLEGRVTRRLTVASAVAVDSSRGLGDDGRAAMPALQELRASASVAHDQTIRDVLRLELAWAAASFEIGGTASLGTITAGWDHAAARAVRLRLAASASQARERDGTSRTLPGGAAEVDAVPALLGRPLRARLALRAVSAIDRFGAEVEERVGADGGLTWEPVPRWSLGAAAAAGRVVEPGGYFASRGELRAGWRSTPRVTLYATGWSEWHRDGRVGLVSTTYYWGSSLGVELLPLAR